MCDGDGQFAELSEIGNFGCQGGAIRGGQWFGLVAWPAEHGQSGVMTFQVGPQGIVYQKDLGPGTAEAVKAIAAFDPDESWTPVR